MNRPSLSWCQNSDDRTTHLGRAWRLVLVLIAWLLITPAVVYADGIIIPRPPIERPIPWREIPLTVKYHRVEVTIRDQVATTRIDQVFVNDAGFAVEGTYVFPLPEGAAISSFDMWVDGQKLEGKLLSREQARAIYEEIVRSQRDPALLEYVGRGAFQASIFPIPPRGERRIELVYSEVLTAADGLVHYRYPLNTEKFSARPLEEVTVNVILEERSGLRLIYSPSHPVEVRRGGNRAATVSYAARNVRPDRDFELYYSTSTDAITANLLSYKPFDEDGFFLLLVTPPWQPSADATVDKDVILVLDVSGSMEGAKLQQAKAAADYVLDHLNAGDRFNIVAFSTATRLFAPGLVPASRRAEGQQFIHRLTAQGSTDINRALLEALTGVDADRPTVLIFLTDGLPTAGETNPDRIIANVARHAARSVRLFAFGVGNDVDTVLLDQLSREQRGASAYVRPDQKIDEEVSGFYARISAPVLVDIGLTFTGVQVEEIYPYPLPDLFAGTQLVVAGRYRGSGSAILKLTGVINGQSQSYTYRNLDFASRGGAEFIPALWAQRKIGYLLAQIRLHGVRDELVKEVIALSTRYGIVTPYTSFLVQEPQLALTQSGREQLRRDLQTPAPGLAAPQALRPADRSGAQAVERAQAEKALQTAEQPGQTIAQVRQIGAKAFLLQGDVWLDTAFDPSQMQAETIAFGSARYFQLLTQHPEIGRYLALGDQLVVVLEGKAYAIGSTGQTAPAEATGATPSPMPTLQPHSATATPTTTDIPPVTPVATPTPAPVPAASHPAQLPPLCPGAVLSGLLALSAPIWLRRRWR